MKWVIIISTLSIFLTATRGWILAFSIVLFLTLLQFYSHIGAKHLWSIGLTGLAFLLVLMLFSPMLESQISNAFQRFSTVKELAKGDISAGGTTQRLDIRGPRVLSKFKESPVFGWGFSDQYFEYRDGHVGHHTTLLNVGIVGYLIFTFFFVKWLILITKKSKINYIRAKYGNAVKIYAFALIFIYIIHSTSHTYWGFALAGWLKCLLPFILLLTSFNVTILKSE